MDTQDTQDWPLDETSIPLNAAVAKASAPSTKPSPRSEALEFAVERAKLMLRFLKASYNYDPVALPLAMAEILAQYPQAVIERVTSPTGLASRCEWPSLKDLNEACIEATSHHDRIATKPLAPLPPVERPPKLPGYRANVKVYPDAPQFMAVKMAVESGTLDVFDWRHDRDGAIWIALSVWRGITSGALASTFRTMGDAELRAFYGVREAAAAKKAAIEDDPFAGL